jgi:hypothetical protein
MAGKSQGRRGRPPKGQESKMSAVLAFTKNPPRNWEQLSSRERKDRVCKTVGINQPYLQQLITKNEDLKDFFGIVRRQRREKTRIRYPDLAKQAKALDLNDLIALSKSVRQEIKRRIDLAQAEYSAK